MSGKQLKLKAVKQEGVSTNEFCRLCLAKCNGANLLDIFDSTTDTTISSRILLCTGLQIDNNDNWPNKCCYECRYQLEKSFLFRNKCKNSDTKLQRHFWLINSGNKSDVLDDSEDEFEDQYRESHNLIANLEKQRMQKFKETASFREALEEAVNQEKERLIQDEMERIYDEAKQSIQEQLESETFASKETRRTTTKATKANQKTTQEIVIRYNEEFIDEDEFNPLETIEDAQENNDMFMIDSEPEFHEMKYEPRSPNHRQNYMVLDSGDVALSEDIDYYPTEMMSEDDALNEDSQNEEYLEDEDFDESSPEEYEQLLPVIKKTIASRADLQLSGEIKYKFTKKPGKIIEVQCTTSDGKVVCVEMEDNRELVEQNALVDENGEYKIFQCEQCPETFSRRQQLLSHLSSHKEKIRGLKCTFCLKWFPSNSTLKRHERIHTGEKPFKCETCGRCFIQKEILKRHMMIHTGERPNKCQYCDKTFILKETLRQHINRNHMENPVISLHKCMICPKTFCHSSGLSRHLLVHAGRTFDCELCSKKFNDRSALKRHVATIHKKKLTTRKK